MNGRSIREFREAAVLALLLAGVFSWLPYAQGQEGTPYGVVIRVSVPISGDADNNIKRMIRRALADRPATAASAILILEFRPRGTENGAGTDISRATSLADFLTGPELADVHTVAFIPEPIKGHATLVALACAEIVMGPEATLGEAAEEGAAGVSLDVLSEYRKIAERRKTIPVAVALGFVNQDAKVYKARTAGGLEFVSEEELEKLRRDKAIVGEPEVFKDRGVIGRITAAQARELGFVKYLTDRPEELARALGLPPDVLEQDPSLGGKWEPIQVPIHGAINSAVTEQIPSLLAQQVDRRGVNFVLLWIDSAGGNPEASVALASSLADFDPSRVRTVAYIPHQARGDAALIALACDQIVMHPNAVLGGPGAYALSDDESKVIAETLRRDIMPKKNRAWSLAASVIDPSLEVRKYQRRQTNLVEYFSTAELAERADQGEWVEGEVVSPPGRVLQVDGSTAHDLRLARHVVADFEEFKSLYGLEDDPNLVEPGWADILIDALASPGLAWLLLLVGAAAIYAELQSPGIGVGAFIATICFALFFWSRYLDGTAAWLEILLFIIGVAFLLVELFVLPGFGIFGLGGGFLILVSLVLASQTFILPRNAYQMQRFRDSLLTVGAAGMGAIVTISLLRRYLPHTPVLGQMYLRPLDEVESEALAHREALVDLRHLLGRQGVTTTTLLPSGKARCGDEIIDVTTEGDVIGPNARVVVVEVRGNRVVVREA